MKVYLSPSDQKGNKGVGTYGTEAYRMQQLCDKVKAKLIAKGHTVYGATNDLNLDERIADSNKSGANLHVALHSNATTGSGTARGPEAHYYPNNLKGKRLASCILAEIASVPGCAPSRGVKATDLYELRSVTATATLLEVAFHDNEEDAKWIVSKMDQIADAIVTGICEY